MRLALHLGSVATLDPGQYCEDGGTYHVRCTCGGISRLDEYEVHPGGRVSPRWFCPMPGCPRIEFLMLEPAP